MPLPIRAALMLATVLAACRPPEVTPLEGTAAPVAIPAAELPPVHRTIVFRWDFRDPEFRARGEGVARVAPPDSVRLDLFLPQGAGGGRATLIGERLRTTGPDQVRDIIPPVPLLWAALGRLRVPAAPDTVARVDGDALRVEIGREPAWRATFRDRELRRLAHIERGRVPEWVERDPAGRVVYEHAPTRRRLELTIVRVDTVSGFDETIWR